MRRTTNAQLLGACVLVPSVAVSGCSQDEDGSLELVGSGQSFAIEDASYGGIGAPGTAPHTHLVQLEFQGIRLEFFFPSGVNEDVTLDLAPPPDDGGSAQGASLMDFNGFEGGARSFCAASPGFPENAAVSGTLRIDRIVVGEQGGLCEVVGSIDVALEGCTVEVLQLEDAPLELSADFNASF